MTNFSEELGMAAADTPDHPALKLDDDVVTYADLEARVARTAGALRAMGVQRGDRVGMQLPNVLQFPIAYFAVLRLGAIVVPLNPLLKGGEVAYHQSHARARLILGWHEFENECRAGADEANSVCISITPAGFEAMFEGATPLEEVVNRRDDDPAVIIYTSGTTGRPKGAALTHGNLRAGAEVASVLVGGGPRSVAVATLPLSHVFGMNSLMNTSVLARGLMTLVSRFDPTKVLEVIERDGATTFAGVPTMYAALLARQQRGGYDVSTVDVCVSGGAAMPVQVLRGIEEAFGAKVLGGYGLSETTGMASFNVQDRERKPGSIGMPVGGTEMMLVDDDGKEVQRGQPGEIVRRGPFVMRGYWDDDHATAKVMNDGWFHTGDVATVDGDGYFFIIGRKKDLIIRGGFNVYPREIEEVLYTHPDVLEAAVVGVPHHSLGEEVGAAVVLRPGAETSTEDLRQYVKDRVAPYKYPRTVWLCDELPKGPTGKVLKRGIVLPAASDGLGTHRPPPPRNEEPPAWRQKST